jgi:hypothetical protein
MCGKINTLWAVHSKIRKRNEYMAIVPGKIMTAVAQEIMV